MDLVSAILIFTAAGLGALSRWLLGIALNPLLPQMPLGTLAANVIGGLLMGLLVGWFASSSALSPAMRLALTTGFLGGLTTFSTFSAESMTLLLRTQYCWAALHLLAHVGLSLIASFAGLALAQVLIGASAGGIR